MEVTVKSIHKCDLSQCIFYHLFIDISIYYELWIKVMRVSKLPSRSSRAVMSQRDQE